jgi:phosphoribosylaminoimidazolecarboxamide formyltransferase/IMP cyclohydrolase
MTSVRRALISVHDKTGVVDFARGLHELGAEILSTGGTAKLLRESGVAVVDVAEVTGFPEMLDGRVKTLHPKVHGGILARRDLPEHVAALERHGIRPIDLVAVTLYPFEKTVARAGVTLEEAIENIDIGGPSMIRGAAKNHAHVAVITDPGQYRPVLDELRSTGGALSADTRSRLAFEAFRRTAQYDAAIAAYLRDPGSVGRPAAAAAGFPERLSVEGVLVQSLRYGENPHQTAAFYRPAGGALGLSAATQLHGPELSYNNLLDWSAALALARVRRPGGGGDQAHQSVRGRARPGRGRSGAEGQGLRSGLHLRRHRGGESPGRPRGREGAVGHLFRDPPAPA